MQTILIIEDDPIVAHIYTKLFIKNGFDATVARDGKSGLEVACKVLPHGILLDLMLPHVNGIEILKSLRSLPEFQFVPIIAYTNVYIPTLVEEAKAAGATRVYGKANVAPNMLVEAFRHELDSVQGSCDAA